LALALIPGLTFALFAPVLTAWFIADDFLFLGWGRDWSLREWLDFSFDPSAPFYFRPVQKLAIRGLIALFGEEAVAYHIAIVGLHAADGFLVFLLARRFFSSTWAPWLAAFLFVAHPAYLWPATWLSSINEPLSVFFLLLALLALPRPGATWYWRQHALALVLLALALLSKESTVLMPAVAAALLLAQRGISRSSIREAAPYGALVLAYLLFRRLSDVGFEGGDYGIGIHGLANFRKYLGLLVFPHLHFLGGPHWDVQRAVAGAVPALLLWVALRRGIVQAGLLGLWLVAAISPYIFFDFTTPRYLYLAGVPFALLVAAAWDASEDPSGRPWLPARLAASWLPFLERSAITIFAFFVLATAVWQMDNITAMYDDYEEFRGLVQEVLPEELPAGSRLIIHYPADFPNPLWGPDMNNSAFVWIVHYLYPGVSQVTFVGPETDLPTMEVTVVPPEVIRVPSYSTAALPP
jgi:hypothetical protein